MATNADQLPDIVGRFYGLAGRRNARQNVLMTVGGRRGRELAADQFGGLQRVLRKHCDGVKGCILAGAEPNDVCKVRNAKLRGRVLSTLARTTVTPDRLLCTKANQQSLWCIT